MRYAGPAKILLSGNRHKAGLLISRIRTWFGIISTTAIPGKPFRHHSKLEDGIIFKCYSNGKDVTLEIFVPEITKPGLYLIFDPHSFKQLYAQGWGSPFRNSAGVSINYPYGSDLPIKTRFGKSFKRAIWDADNFTHEFGEEPPEMPGNCLWINGSGDNTVSWWGNSQNAWVDGSSPTGPAPSWYFFPNELYNSFASAGSYTYAHKMEYAKLPLPAGSSTSKNPTDWEDGWEVSGIFDGNTVIWVNGKPIPITSHIGSEGGIITGASLVGEWLVYRVGTLSGFWGVDNEYLYAVNINKSSSIFLLDEQHFTRSNEVDVGAEVYWKVNTGNANISEDGLNWCTMRLEFINNSSPGSVNYNQILQIHSFSIDGAGKVVFKKSEETLNVYRDLFPLTFGYYGDVLYKYFPEENNSFDYETSIFWNDVRWNSAIGIQTSGGIDADYFFIKIQGTMYKYKFGPNLNNIDFENPILVKDGLLPDTLGSLGGSAYRSNRRNFTCLAFEEGLIFSMSGENLNPDVLQINNSSGEYPQYNHRGYCYFITPDGKAVNMHNQLLDKDFDANNGRFATIMLSTKEIQER